MSVRFRFRFWDLPDPSAAFEFGAFCSRLSGLASVLGLWAKALGLRLWA